MKIYAISGLGADDRAYQFLELEYEIEVLQWIEPGDQESLQSYALRLSQAINTTEEFGLMGLSFGGLIAVEMSKFLNPRFTILISTAEVTAEIPWYYGSINKTKVISVLPDWFFKIPAWVVIPVFKTRQKKLVAEIIKDTDPAFIKWAITGIMNWKNDIRLKNRLKITGTRDLLFPAKRIKDVNLVQGGGHFMVVDNAREVSATINQWLNKVLDENSGTN